jgi:hypothetical protein
MSTAIPPSQEAAAQLAMITQVSFMITEGRQRYSLRDYRDHEAGHSGGVRKQDPGRPDPGLP